MRRSFWALGGLVLGVLAMSASPAQAGSLTFDQGFETDASGWFDSDDYTGYGDVSRVASGTNSVTSSNGSFHAEVSQTSYGPFTRFGGYSDTFGVGFSTCIDIYLDTAWSAGEGFDYSVAASNQSGGHLRDFIFHVTQDTSSGNLLVGGSNNTNFDPREDLDTLNHYQVSSSGWYTFEHIFRDNGGVLAVDLNLRDSSGSLLFTETRSDGNDLIATVVGGNRYGWFTNVDIANGIAIDDTQLKINVVPLPPAAGLGLGLLGMIGLGSFMKRRRALQSA